MEMGRLKGWHASIFMVAFGLFVLLPIAYLIEISIPDRALRDLLVRAVPFVFAAVALLAVPAWRRWAAALLAIPIPRGYRREIFLVTVLDLTSAFAFFGAIVLWLHYSIGAVGLEQWVAAQGSHVEGMADSFTFTGLLYLALSATVVPVIEELVFRGYLNARWEKRFGWFIAMVLSSFLFALMHSPGLHAFLAGVILSCLYRRTGSLRAAILVHAMYNLLQAYWLLGQFELPRTLLYPGDLESWRIHLGALFVVLVAVPGYAWLARDAREPGFEIEDHAALPR